jgi:hypothetical protein
LLGRLALRYQIATQEVVHRETVGELNRRLHHLLEPQSAFRFECDRHRIEHRRNRRAERPVARRAPFTCEECGRRRFRRRALPVDDDHLVRRGVINDGWRFAAKAEVGDLAHGRGEHCSDTGVHGIAALLQDPDAAGDRIMASGGDDAMCAENLRLERVGARHRCGLRAGCRAAGCEYGHRAAREKGAVACAATYLGC